MWPCLAIKTIHVAKNLLINADPLRYLHPLHPQKPVPPSHSCRDRRANQRRSTCGPLPHQPWDAGFVTTWQRGTVQKGQVRFKKFSWIPKDLVKLEIGSQLDPKIIRGCFPTLCLHPLRIWPQFSKALGITYVGPFSMNYEPVHLLCKCIHINKHKHIHVYIYIHIHIQSMTIIS